MARAKEEHANQLVIYLSKNKQTTRDILKFYEHYESSNQEVRNRMVNNPLLFFESIKNKDKEQAAKILNMGPEGKWKKNLDIITNITHGLKKLITTVFYSNQDENDKNNLQNSFKETQRQFLEFELLVEKHIHAITTDSSNNIRDARGR